VTGGTGVWEWAPCDAPAIERLGRRYQRVTPSSALIVEGSEDPRSALGRTTAIDQLEQGVHVGAAIGGQRIGAPGLEAGALEPPPAPRDNADQITVDVCAT
jgi:hypothetical protein